MTRIAALSGHRARSSMHEEPLRLGMAQLAPDGLSEQWLLRHCGDVHWALIAGALGQERAVFHDREGREAYAAFCATSLELAAPDGSMPGGLLFGGCLSGADASLAAEAYRVGASRIGSVHHITRGSRLLARLRMVSTFVSHDETRRNRRIMRNQGVDTACLPPAPADLSRFAEAMRLKARAMARVRSAGAPCFRAKPCRSLDFNAVGLLYFPAFSRLAEVTEAGRGEALGPLARRDVLYLGNVDMGEGLEIVTDTNGLLLCRAEGTVIAHVRSERHGTPAGRVAAGFGAQGRHSGDG